MGPDDVLEGDNSDLYYLKRDNY